MTPAEAIAALEAAYPGYEFAVCYGPQTVWQRTQAGKVEKRKQNHWSISVFKGGKSLFSRGGKTLTYAALLTRAALSQLEPFTQTQRAIEKVAAQMEEGK